MTDFRYSVIVSTDTREHANQVMGERLAHDEDYGFEYEVGFEVMLNKYEVDHIVMERLRRGIELSGASETGKRSDRKPYSNRKS